MAATVEMMSTHISNVGHIHVQGDPGGALWKTLVGMELMFSSNTDVSQEAEIPCMVGGGLGGDSSGSSDDETYITSSGTRKVIKSVLDIYFSQNSIKNSFQDGRGIGATLDLLLEDKINCSDFEMMTLVFYEGHWVSLDNRRLWVMKMFAEARKIDVMVEVIEKDHIDAKDRKKLTSKDGGLPKVRGDEN